MLINVRRLLFKLYSLAVKNSPIRLAVTLARIYFRATGKKIRLTLNPSMELLRIEEGDVVHWVTFSHRALMNFANGISGRASRLAREYMLDEITDPIRSVIDVGANNGDFLLCIGDELSDYLAMEPVYEEAKALELNAKSKLPEGSVVLPVAVSDTSGSFPFYISAAGADSSPIEPKNGFTEVREIHHETLDVLCLDFKPKSGQIDLIKIEAEGFEPEILRGALATFKRAKYVVIDGGPERGPEAKTTIEDCTNFLLENGFSLIRLRLRHRPGVGLFTRKHS